MMKTAITKMSQARGQLREERASKSGLWLKRSRKRSVRCRLHIFGTDAIEAEPEAPGKREEKEGGHFGVS